MNAPIDDVANKTIQWMRYGDEDLRLAQYAQTMSEDCPFRLIAYHAQQCAEKYLKAYLVFNEIDFPYTHNISRLLELAAPSTAWMQTLSDAEELSPFAITTRYPGQDEDVTAEEANKAIDTAVNVRKAVRAELARMALPGEWQFETE